MKISWILLTWNSEKYIENCLRSIVDLDGIDSQIIVVDNGSNDHTVEIIGEFNNNIHAVELIKNTSNQGTTKPRNIGLRKADRDSDYICILDSDTVVNLRAVKTLIGHLSEDDRVLIAGPKLVTSNGVEQPSARTFPTLTTKIYKACPIKSIEDRGRQMEKCPNESKTEPFQADVIMSACWMMKPEILDKVGYLDEFYFYSPEDTEYCLRTQMRGYKVLYCPDAQIIHEWQRLSKKKIISKVNYESLKGHFHMFKQYGYCFNTKNLKKRMKSAL